MSDYRTSGIHQVNKWLWSLLKDFQYFDNATQLSVKAFDAYGTASGKVNLVPFIPSQQIPEFTNLSAGAPFIVYSYVKSTNSKDWFISAEKASYTIWDADEERLRAIHNYMFDLLRRFDDTATAINKYLGVSSYNFKYVQAANAMSAEPFVQEGGRQAANISISYEFTNDLDGLRDSATFGMRV